MPGFKEYTLTKLYRQTDPIWGARLSRVRTATQTDQDLEVINTRVRPSAPPGAICVCMRKYMAERMNDKGMNEVGGDVYSFQGELKGSMKRKTPDIPLLLNLKLGCQVVIKANSRKKINGILQEVDNGDGGTFHGVDKNRRLIIELERSKEMVYIGARKFKELTPKSVDGKLTYEETGSYVQYPVMPGYASTINAAQGGTLPKVHVMLELKIPFNPCMIYVALSRVPDFSGLTINRPITHDDIYTLDTVKAGLTEQEELPI